MSKSFKRRPKGSGTTYKLSGNRRKPYVAAITLGTDEETGKQIQKPIGYFASEIEALNALSAYNMNPSEFNNQIRTITVGEIWDILVEKELVRLSENTMAAYKIGFNSLSEIHNKNIKDLTLFNLQPIFDNMSNNKNTKSKMDIVKVVLSKIYNYAMRYEYISKDYSKLIKVISKVEPESKKPFSETQIKWLFEHDKDITVQSILIMIYSGMRPSEMLQIKKENIHLDERYMIGGLKTKAGTDRVIPIHECIIEYIKNVSQNNTEYMFAPSDKPLKISHYANTYFSKIRKLNDWDLSPHSARHTFISLANKYGLKDINTKKIVGHISKDITKDIYTHIDAKDLIEEINKIPKIC